MTAWIDSATDFFKRIPVRVKAGSLPELYRNVFDSEEGRAVLADLHRKAGIMEPSIGLSSDHLQYATGGRDMILYINKMLRLRPAALQQISAMETINERE